MSTSNWSSFDLMQTYSPRFKPERARLEMLRVHMDLKSGAPHSGQSGFTVEVHRGSCSVYAGLQGIADLLVSGSTESIVRLERGELTAQEAIQPGLVSINDLSVWNRFTACFSRLSKPNNSNQSATTRQKISSSEDNKHAKEQNTSTEKIPGLEATTRKPNHGPLQGIRILDLSRLLPGPLAGMMLADMGADVIKIEKPREPDYVRHYPPFQDGQSAYYLALNRSKRSLALDTQTPEGRDLFFQLVETADVVLESFRPGILDKLGIGYQDAQKRNPKIIYASVTGYGQSGPYAHHAGHDINYMGYAGLLSLTADQTGKPIQPGLQMADIAGGSYPVVMGILAALVNRNITGWGQHVDVAMTDAVQPLSVLPLAEFSTTGLLPRPGMGPLSGGLAIYGIYTCKDGKHMALGALEPKFWMRFCEAAGVISWAGRMLPDEKTQQELKTDLETLFASRDQAEWIALGQKADCCLSPVLDLSEVQHNEHNKFRQQLHPTPPELQRGTGTSTIPIHFSQSPASASWPAPTLGQDTQSILNELNITPEMQSKLRETGVIR